jgi:O-acetyl-ADP-ribose deacetylase (regulator of RNase III)
MIEYKRGDILAEDAEALVNSVNCVGIMGRGVALQFKKAYPANFKAYEVACRHRKVEPGRMFVFETKGLTNPRYVINFPSKRHWRGKARIEDIDAGLQALVAEIRNRRIRSVAIPPLGSGLGGLDWADVRPRIERALEEVPDVRVVVFEPKDGPKSEERTESRRIPSMTPGRAALVSLMDRYLAGLMDPFVTLLEVHKLMYFMQEAGEPLRLRYVPAPYGPYAENLRHVLQTIEGYYVSGYGDGGDAPQKLLQLVPGAIADAKTFLAAHPDTHARFERVAGLVEGFETPFGLELLSTVHWVATREDVGSDDELVARTYAWADRKRQYSPQQILLARRVLAEKGWWSRQRADASRRRE